MAGIPRVSVLGNIYWIVFPPRFPSGNWPDHAGLVILCFLLHVKLLSPFELTLGVGIGAVFLIYDVLVYRYALKLQLYFAVIPLIKWNIYLPQKTKTFKRATCSPVQSLCISVFSWINLHVILYIVWSLYCTKNLPVNLLICKSWTKTCMHLYED